VFATAERKILACITPHPSQLDCRASIMTLVKRQVRYVLKANAFEAGLHEIRCFLPDDPTRLTIILGKHFAN
jgi:hypothetical protein